jgi:septal ring factor EnvC (AmiA/AmiB activator)
MTEEEKKLLSSFETRLRHLIYLHEESERKNARLQSVLDKERMEKEQLAANYEQLKKDYADLKDATALSGGGVNAKDTKLRIDKLVREIDLCIAQLE